jgi:hypothetical protein
MAKKNERDADREQAAEPASEQPIVELSCIEINKQGQLVSKTEYLHQNAERARKRVPQPLKRRRRSRQDPIRAAIIQKWGSDWPPDTLPTPEALRELDHELDRLGIKASPDSKKRAMGRRD